MIRPGSTIGILGSGQLSRMVVHAAQRLGYRVHVYSPETDSPAGQAANLEITAAYDDLDACRRFARQVDVVTVESDGFPIETINAVSKVAPLYPGQHVLPIAGNRIHQKMTLESLGMPMADFAIVNQFDEAKEFAISKQQNGAVLKVAERRTGGPGLFRISSVEEAESAFQSIDHAPAIIEEFVACDFELSVISARSQSGQVRSYEPITNTHRNNTLDVSVSPSSRVSPRLRAELIDIAESLIDSLDIVGLLCVEFFYAHDGRILVNGISTGPHNSGHLTVEACITSQFEQQVRAVCGLPLGSSQLVCGAAMANLVGQQVPETERQFSELLEWPTAKLHLYGKVIPTSGRKMGHISVTADCADIAEARVREARNGMLLVGRKVELAQTK